MSGNKIREYAIGASGVIIVLYVLIYVFNTIVSMPVAPEPGDLFYPAHQSLIYVLGDIIPLLAPGVTGAAAVVIGYFAIIDDSGGF